MNQNPTYEELVKRIHELEKEVYECKTLMKLCPYFIARFDINLRCLYVNPAAARAGLLTKENKTGKTIRELQIPEHFASKWEKNFQKVLETGIPVNYEDQLMTEDGIRYYQIKITSEMASDGTVKSLISFASDYAVGVNTDITKRKQAENMLRESEEKFRLLLEHLPQSIFVKDRSSVYITCNNNYADGLGIESHMIAGKTDYDFHPKEMADKYRADDQKVISSGESISIEEKYFKFGEERWVWTTKVPYRDKKGNIVGVLGIFQDITDHKYMEDALNENQIRSQAMLNAIPDLMFRIDHQGVFLDYKADEKHLYTSPIIGKRNRDIMPPEFADLIDRKILDTLKSGVVQTFEYHLPIPEKGIRDYEARMIVSGKYEVIAIVRDITERKRSAERIYAQSRLLDLIFTHTLDSIVLMDAQYNFIRVSETYAKACQRDASEFPGHNHFEFFPSNLKDEFDEACKDKKIYQRFARPFIFPDHPEWGITYWDLELVPIIDNKGEIELFLFTLKDVTESKRAEQEYQKLEAQLRHSQKMEAIGQLTGGIAHDFNNLLQVIMGYGEIIQNQFFSSVLLQQYIGKIIETSQKAVNLIRQLLLFSRREVMRCEYLILNDIIVNLIKMIKRLIGEYVHVEMDLSQNLKKNYADPGQIEQVIMNLCINARDAMPNGGKIRIETSNTAINQEFCKRYLLSQEGEYVLLTISDTGCGIPYEMQERIFEPFFTTKEVGKGTGLGLATCYGIIKAHQGIILFDSELGKGTTFKIYLPISNGDIPKSKEGFPQIIPTVSNKEIILYAEDEEEVRNMISGIMRNGGYQVIEASNGREAICIFEEKQKEIQMAILDVVMPEVSGQKVLEKIKQLHPDLPVLFCSGYSEEFLDDKIFKDCKCQLIHKPVTSKQLLAKIREMLDAK